MKRILLILPITLILFSKLTVAQTSLEDYFDRITLAVDTNLFTYGEDTFQNEKRLFFRFDNHEEVAEIRLYPNSKEEFFHFELIESGDFSIMDKPLWVNEDHYRLKVKFSDLYQSSQLSLIFDIQKDEEQKGQNLELRLYPYSPPLVIDYNESIELFRGEERTVDIELNNNRNYEVDSEWKQTDLFEYKLIRNGDDLKLVFKALKQGAQTFLLPLKTIRPYLDDNGKLSHEGPVLEIDVIVKPGRIVFLNPDREVIFMDESGKGREQIQLDHHRNFQLDKTYRIEDRSENNGRLIAEITPKSNLGNNKVLCDIVTYTFHQTNEGYLYIKDGSKTLFLTNFNIISRPKVKAVEILREGGDWTSTLAVYPGEEFEMRIQGSGLSMTEFDFHPLEYERDSVRVGNQVVFYHLRVPNDIDRKKISVFMNENITQFELRIREYKRPADLDFVMVNYGKNDIPITHKTFNEPVFTSNTMKDINILFDPSKIDKYGEFYGKQYLDIEVRVISKNHELLDIQNINNIVVCPGERSKRHAFYDLGDCNYSMISLNNYLLRKTYDMDAYSHIELLVKHKESAYSEPIKSRKIKIFAERKTDFDLQVSFPAGLLVKDFDESGIGNLTGISISILAQLSFYNPNRIGRMRPYKISAGFIAFNAFNFNESPDIDRDIGVVVLGSIEPIRTNRKFSVPIYAGIGYKLKNENWFFIFGPGIQFQF